MASKSASHDDKLQNNGLTTTQQPPPKESAPAPPAPSTLKAPAAPQLFDIANRAIAPPVPIPLPDVVPPGQVSTKRFPLDAAAEVVDEFVQTLQFKDQINALTKKVEEYINVFQGFYSESKKIAKAKDAGSSYSSPNCTVKLNHQAIDRVKAGTAYQACSKKLGALIQESKLALSAYELELMTINCNGRKSALIDIMAATLNLVARYVCVVYEIESDPNNIAANFLLKHHTELLKFSSTPLGVFTSSYKRVNDCGHNVRRTTDVYNYFFARAATTKVIEDAPANKDSTNPLQTPAGSITLPTPNNLFPPGTNSTKPTTSERQSSTAQSTTSSLTSESAKSKPQKIVLDGVEYIQSTLAGENAAKEVPGEPVTISTTPLTRSGFVSAATLLNTSSTAAAKSTPVTDIFPEILEAYGKSYLSRKHTEEELKFIAECGQMADAAYAKSQHEAKLKLHCTNWALIDSIRAKTTFEVAAPPSSAPDSSEPPVFPEIPNKESSDAIPPPHENAPDVPIEHATALSVMWDCMKVFFLVAPSVFIKQWEINYKANQLSKITSKAGLEESATGTATVIFKDLDDPNSKTATEVNRRKNAASQERSKRKAQSTHDKTQSEYAQLVKKKKKLKAEIASYDKLLKDHGGKAKTPQTKTNTGKRIHTNRNLTWVRQPDNEDSKRQGPVGVEQGSAGGTPSEQPSGGKQRQRYSKNKKKKKNNTAKR